MLKDIQGESDARGIALDEVGIDQLRYPLLVADGQGGKREVVASVTMSVSLDSRVRGAHLSRFVDVLHEWRDQLGPDTMLGMVDDLRRRMNSTVAHAALSFPYFLERRAPVTRTASFMDYACTLTVSATEAEQNLVQQVRVPVTSVCPCSKAISDRGAHNQRGWITIDAKPRELRGDLWLNDLIEVAESAGSSPVYALLKRPDERYVTMAGYDNPVFVEDIARDVARTLASDHRVVAYRVRVVNDESIHNHAAYAQIGWTTVAGHDQGGWS